jgi:hypothetical protein
METENENENEVVIRTLQEIEPPKRKKKVPSDLKKVYNQKFYENHKEQLMDRLKQKVECDLCGKMIAFYGLHRHKNRSNCVNQNCVRKSSKREANELREKLQQLELQIASTKESQNL